VIFDYTSGRHTQLAWDANGNLALLWMCGDKFARFHDWDDENRLRMVLDNMRTGYYGYDANGDRVYKLIGGSEITHTDDESSDALARFDNAVLYPNPYVTITKKGYTKHYYANGERLATSIGAGGFCIMVHEWISLPQTAHEENLLTKWSSIYSNEYPFEYHHESLPTLTYNVDIAGQDLNELQYWCPIRRLKRLKVEYEQDILRETMSHFCEAQGEEDGIFYTHGDHLGSASWITDCGGHPIQYLHYLPYGQLLANQTPYGYDERYKFTGKERDAETGYDFFGARYYWSLFKHWTSTDPLLDNSLYISPYAYCNWNPVNRIDFDGMDDEQREAAINKANQYVKMNPGKSYGWGAKGDPGQKVDCSGLVSKCAIAGGEKDPNKGQYNGVRNIANNTQKIEDMNDIEAGNFVIFKTGGRNGDYSHIGIITDVTHDDDGNVVDFQFIHSGYSTGPTRTSANSRYSRNSPLCWKDIVTGFYKWDTRPDTHKDSVLPQITALGDKPSWMNPIYPFSISPITININPCIRR
jgi:RHS repeat-associated protein